jgi:hypothetical protein
MIPTMHKLGPRQCEAFERAKRTGYLVDRSRTSTALFSAYWNWCSEEGRASVVVHPATKYARVKVDMLPADTLGNKLSRDTASRLARTILNRHGVEGSTVAFGRDWSEFRKIPVERAEKMAAELVRGIAESAS